MGKRRRKLRTGFTTGSSAAAAAKAAVLVLGGQEGPSSVDIPLPEEGRLQIPVGHVEREGAGARALVIKDAGDDPDVTHRAQIWCTVTLNKGGAPGHVVIKGGRGVGRVTRPGLPVLVGESAINPAPRRQITKAVLEGLRETGHEGEVTVRIEVPRGEEMARKTLNSRLGIVGGISILGTRGTVIPFSNQAYKATITLAMDVAQAQGSDTMVLSTGGRSERFMRNHRKDLPEVCFIQVADFFRFSLEEASQRSFRHIAYACFFGKLLKMARGHGCTHARKSTIDLPSLSHWSREEGMDDETAGLIKGANTAREALEIISGSGVRDGILRRVIREALFHARGFAGKGPRITYCVFSTEGELLAEMTDEDRDRDPGG
ncbi:MAG: cobalt-precorrin-5B (C(1))-methyltransferase [Deltaproteobacteria bacterium]|nr:cobalt-precorrin-5B (C(1))-methyltransferase [Deltaproteobacteria bacterium]MBW2137393.1 cobalt-precorrin-5B (C(1))-methyltransferase [Deltaproteobacteria bacterium]